MDGNSADVNDLGMVDTSYAPVTIPRNQQASVSSCILADILGRQGVLVSAKPSRNSACTNSTSMSMDQVYPLAIALRLRWL